MTPLVRLVARAILPVGLAMSLTHVVGAGDGPGDGFTAGIISALALTLEYELLGYRDARAQLHRLRFDRVAAAGIAVVVGAAIVPVVAGAPVLGAIEATVPIPLLGDVKLDRALLFDIGIYLVVVGGAMTAVEALRSHRE